MRLIAGLVFASLCTAAFAQSGGSLVSVDANGNAVKYVIGSTAPAPPPPQPPAAPFSAFVSAPVPNRVFQQVGGSAALRINWRGTIDTVRVRRASDGVAMGDSATGEFTLAAGWYSAVLVTGGVEGDSIPFGVGDVYLVAGQSNAVSPLQPSTYVYPRPSARGKVIISNFYQQGFYSFLDTVDDIPWGPGQGGIAWIEAGIALNRAWPVMFINVAWGNTSTDDWSNVRAADIFRANETYAPKAILWHQGESDSLLNFTQDRSYQNLKGIISSLRQISPVPWVIAINSLSPQYAPVRAAQQQVISYWGASSPPIAFLGPDTDTIRTAGQTEFLGPALKAHGDLWAQRLIALGL